ncbi:DUF2512 family protein [Niallia circulans]|uniref:DUF2512 family protein n=1 Tax=Niallia circulans TaxID=1397 RepID=UPI001561193D|nr:DUF2512 family protein [Niallia circulans]NRG35218.1 DUF2512 family protein [Niallia circulans]
MSHLKAIVIKLIMILLVLGIILTGIFDGEFGNTLWISIVLTIAAYIIGDLFIFRKIGDDAAFVKRNIIATVSDAILTVLIIYLMGKSMFADDNNLSVAAILSAVVIGIGEWFFHKYLNNNVFEEKPNHPESTF